MLQGARFAVQGFILAGVPNAERFGTWSGFRFGMAPSCGHMFHS